MPREWMARNYQWLFTLLVCSLLFNIFLVYLIVRVPTVRMHSDDIKEVVTQLFGEYAKGYHEEMKKAQEQVIPYPTMEVGYDGQIY